MEYISIIYLGHVQIDLIQKEMKEGNITLEWLWDEIDWAILRIVTLHLEDTRREIISWKLAEATKCL